MRKGKIAGITAVALIFAGLTCTLAIVNRSIRLFALDRIDAASSNPVDLFTIS